MILVTGGAGYIGSHTVLALEEAGYEPVVFDDFSAGHRDFVDGVPLVEGSVCEPDDLRRAFSEHEIEAVIHFAGRALVPESVQRPELYYETNVTGGINLLNAMRRAGVRMLIFSSTCATYGVPKTPLLDEEHPQDPINPYGESKLAFEKALGWFRNAHGLDYLSLRYFNAAGADPDLRRGEDHDPETHLIPLVLAAAAGRRADVKVFGTDYETPDGTCVRDYIHVSDLAEAHVRGMERLIDGSIESQALNLGTGTGVSVREVIDCAREVTERRFEVVEAERRPGDPTRLVASADRARERLEWTPRSSALDRIVQTAWEWSLKRAGARR